MFSTSRRYYKLVSTRQNPKDISKREDPKRVTTQFRGANLFLEEFDDTVTGERAKLSSENIFKDTEKSILCR